MNGNSNEPPETIPADSPARHQPGPDRTASAPEARRAGEAGGLSGPHSAAVSTAGQASGGGGRHRRKPGGDRPGALGQGREARGGVLRRGHRVPRAYGRPGCFIRVAVTDAAHEAFLMEKPSGISRAPRVDPLLAMQGDQGRSMAPRRWTSSRPHIPDRPRAKGRYAWTTASARRDTSPCPSRSSWSLAAAAARLGHGDAVAVRVGEAQRGHAGTSWLSSATAGRPSAAAVGSVTPGAQPGAPPCSSV
ncbi:hypothetical protein SGLAM104S_01655 [Streptomyces glaucescens]